MVRSVERARRNERAERTGVVDPQLLRLVAIVAARQTTPSQIPSAPAAKLARSRQGHDALGVALGDKLLDLRLLAVVLPSLLLGERDRILLAVELRAGSGGRQLEGEQRRSEEGWTDLEVRALHVVAAVQGTGHRLRIVRGPHSPECTRDGARRRRLTRMPCKQREASQHAATSGGSERENGSPSHQGVLPPSSALQNVPARHRKETSVSAGRWTLGTRGWAHQSMRQWCEVPLADEVGDGAGRKMRTGRRWSSSRVGRDGVETRWIRDGRDDGRIRLRAVRGCDGKSQRKVIERRRRVEPSVRGGGAIRTTRGRRDPHQP